MAKKKKLEKLADYEKMLVAMIERRTGADFDEFLRPQVLSCSQTWQMLNRIHNDLMAEVSLIDSTVGSRKQQKYDVNPLLPYYLKLQAELRLQFQALGLNYAATPSKIKEDTRKGVDTESDAMAQLYKDAKR